MDRSEVEQRVKDVTCRVLSVELAQIEETSDFAADLGAESVQSIELVAGFEEEFGIELDEDAALAVSSVGEAVEFVHRHVEEQKGG